MAEENKFAGFIKRALEPENFANITLPVMGLVETIATQGRSPGLHSMAHSELLNKRIAESRAREAEQRKAEEDAKEAAYKRRLEDEERERIESFRKGISGLSGEELESTGSELYKKSYPKEYFGGTLGKFSQRTTDFDKKLKLLQDNAALLNGEVDSLLKDKRITPNEARLRKIQIQAGMFDQIKNLGIEQAQTDETLRRGLLQIPQDVGKAAAIEGAKEKVRVGGAEFKTAEEDRMLDDFYRASTPYRDAKGVYQNVITAANGTTPQDDLFLIYNAVKLNDPNAVREGEIALVREARSIPQQIKLAWDKANSGKMLSQYERDNIIALANRGYGLKAAAQERLVDTYTKRAQVKGLNPEMIVDPVDWFSINKDDAFKMLNTPMGVTGKTPSQSTQPNASPQPDSFNTKPRSWSDEKWNRYLQLREKTVLGVK